MTGPDFSQSRDILPPADLWCVSGLCVSRTAAGGLQAKKVIQHRYVITGSDMRIYWTTFLEKEVLLLIFAGRMPEARNSSQKIYQKSRLSCVNECGRIRCSGLIFLEGIYP